MGLTIHYSLSTDRTELSAIRLLVQEIRELASGLPFQEVGEIVEFQGKACGFEDRDDPRRWLKIQAGRYVEGSGYSNKVSPLHMIAFTTVPGDGSEPANLGICRYPASIDIERPRRQRLRTNLHGWSRGSFCKTQYASDPSYGGTPNFVRCHLSIVGLLDAIQKRQLAKVEVSDESDYWEHRDAERNHPPPIGSTITFRYQELTDGGVPRFPSYVGLGAAKAGRSHSASRLGQEEREQDPGCTAIQAPRTQHGTDSGERPAHLRWLPDRCLPLID